ncbi:MAG: hypothetical protein LRY36_00165 [Alphaproteobacteria bacterium]|nr:hypothetical protein [Alphaproteobacteria bacterium]
MGLRFSYIVLFLGLGLASAFPAQANDMALNYTPPPMFDGAPAPDNETRPEEYAVPEAGFPAQVIENSRLYTLPSAARGVSMGAVLGDVREEESGSRLAAGIVKPPLPLDRPSRFVVSRAYANSLLHATEQKPASLKVRSMNARDVLDSLE